MIFKTLFTPGHKQSDPEKRKASIDKLDPSKENDKRILHELAFNDGNDWVSLTALAKLDSFVLWMKTLETSQSIAVKKRAEQVCIEALEDSAQVNDSLFESFISEGKNKPMLNTLLFTSKRLQQHQTLSLQVLFNLSNESLTRRFYAQIASEVQQLEIVEKTQDAKLLAKYSKQTDHQTVIDLIDAKSKEAELAKLMPAKVKHAVTLINARLLALKESVDYASLNKAFTQLNDEFEQAKVNFIYVDEITSAQLSQKYLSLKALISEKLTNLAEQHKDQLALNKTTADLGDIRQRLNQVRQQVDLLLSSEDLQIHSQVKILSSAVQTAQEEMYLLSDAAQTSAHGQLFTQLQSQIENMQASLLDVPAVISASQQVNQSILQLEEMLSPYSGKEKVDPIVLEALEAQVKQQKLAFEQLKSENSLLPATKVKAFSLSLAKVNKQIQLFKEYYRNIERKCESKLKVVDRMIDAGKFKPAMSTFFHVQKLIESLPKALETSINSRLAKAYAATSEEVQKLQDWQAYIAQPRKPALLEEATKIADSVMEDAYSRVETVKQLRAQWQSFGLLHTDEDDAINKAFDQVIEKAFAPCRLFFADLEKLREKNLKIAQGIIDEASSLDKETPVTELASLLGGFKSRFNKIGEMDNSELRKVKRRLHKALGSINKRVNDFYEENSVSKQKLIDKASQFGTLDDTAEALQQAADEAKALQKQWKAIGFAGKDKENQLWHAFREQNDHFFKRYHEFLAASQLQNDSTLQALHTQVAEIDEKLNAATSKIELSFYAQAYQNIEESVNELDDKSQQKVRSKIRKLDESFQKISKKLDSAKAGHALQKLFDYLRSTSQIQQEKEHDTPKSPDPLLRRYKSWLKGDVKPAGLLQGLSRNELVQVALILADNKIQDAVFGDENRRKDLQMQIMASKLEGNTLILPESVLAVWVSQGQVKPDQMDGMVLLEKLFTR